MGLAAGWMTSAIASRALEGVCRRPVNAVFVKERPQQTFVTSAASVGTASSAVASALRSSVCSPSSGALRGLVQVCQLLELSEDIGVMPCEMTHDACVAEEAADITRC